MRQIDTDNFVMLAYSAGGTYNDYITWQHLNAIKLNINGTINTTGLYLNSSLVNSTATELNYLNAITLGTITASKAITVDASSNINSILRLTKPANSQQILFTNGTSTGTIFQNLNGTLTFGTTSVNDITFSTNNTTRITISSAGVMNIQGGWQISGTTVVSTADELNFVDVVAGLGTASKALVLNASKEIESINRLFIGSFPSTLTSVAGLGVNKSGGLFEEIFYCSQPMVLLD